MNLKKAEDKSDSILNTEIERKAHHHKKAATEGDNSTSKANVTMSLSNSSYKDLNQTFVAESVKAFKDKHKKWDYKMFDNQLEEIATIMTYKDEKYQTMDSKKAFIQQFISKYEACDKNGDNVLDLDEFTNCMKNDEYLYVISPPESKYAAYANYTSSNSTGFYKILYNNLDSYQSNYINFYDYMFLRMLAYSWRKCSVFAPFIEEINFECAIDVITASKSLSRNAARNLYKMGLQLGNNDAIRNMDFITFTLLATSVRLYTRMNTKEDNDLTKEEMNFAIDKNILPERYSQDVIESMFKLVEEFDKPNQGLDLISFVFYDFTLKIFDVPSAHRKFHMNLEDFTRAMKNYLIPSLIVSQLLVFPRNNVTADSYQQYTYLNISVFNSEADHFLKSSFIESHDNILTLVGNNTNFTYNENKVYQLIFNIIDSDSDGWINFYDWASFFQISYLFGRFDNYNKGRITANELMHRYTTYSDYPFISYKLRERAKRFGMIPQAIYVDLISNLVVLKMDELVASSLRSDKNYIYEFELKKILSSVNMRYVSDALLNQCLRNVDDKNVPRYDWECAFIQGVTENLKFYESSFAYLTTKKNNITLANTVFVNVDKTNA
jgi:Ca2+-binding EF-hand superfamily protein